MGKRRKRKRKEGEGGKNKGGILTFPCDYRCQVDN